MAADFRILAVVLAISVSSVFYELDKCLLSECLTPPRVLVRSPLDDYIFVKF